MTISLIPCSVFLIHSTEHSSDILSTLINAITFQLLMLVLISTNYKAMTVMFLPLFRYYFAVIDKLCNKETLPALPKIFTNFSAMSFISYVDLYCHHLSFFCPVCLNNECYSATFHFTLKTAACRNGKGTNLLPYTSQ